MTVLSTVGGEILGLLNTIEDDVVAIRSDMLDFRVQLEGTRQQVAAMSRNTVRLIDELGSVRVCLDRIERRLDVAEVAK